MDPILKCKEEKFTEPRKKERKVIQRVKTKVTEEVVQRR